MRILRIDRVSNEKFLNKIKETILLAIILKRKGDWIRHIIRGKGIFTTVLEGIVEEEKRYGRKIYSFR